MRPWLYCLALLLATGSAPAAAPREATPDDLLARARAALKKGQTKEAVALAGKALELDTKQAGAYLVRGQARGTLGKHREAVADLDRAIALDPRLAEAYHLRGSEQFKLGRITESLADFDRFLELKPQARAGHWQRGISCYYAGRYAEGQKQFEAYQTVDNSDVENVVWRYLCMARRVGRGKARAELLPVGKDRRVPLMEVYALFQGKRKPADVLAAARAGQPTPAQLEGRLFYAHLYVGLYYDSEGKKQLALEHLSKAAEYPAGGYMADVARVHRDLLRQELSRAKES